MAPLTRVQRLEAALRKCVETLELNRVAAPMTLRQAKEALARKRINNATIPKNTLAPSKRLVPCGGNRTGAYLLTEDIANAVRVDRHARNWSQSDLANAAGLSVRTVQDLETVRKACIRIQTLKRVEAVLGMDLDKKLPPERPKRPCAVPGCESAQVCKNLCRKHYSAMRRASR